MRCPIEVGNEAETILAFATGRLTPGEQEAFQLHMAECAECRGLADAQMSVWSALDAWKVPSVSEDFDQKLHVRVAGDARRPWWQRQWDNISHAGVWFSWKPVLPVAAACAVLVGVFLLRNPVTPNGAPVAPAAVVQTQDAQRVDVDQVERALDDMDMLNQLDAPVTAAHAPAGS